MKKTIIGLLVGMLMFATFTSVALPMNIQENTVNFSSMSNADDWPMFHHDLGHTGFSTSIAPKTNARRWTYTTNSTIGSSPAVVDGKIYFAADALYCLDARNGDLIWKNVTAGGVSSPAVVDGKVYAACGYSLGCFDAVSGQTVWTHNFEGDPIYYSSPAVADGRVYIGMTWPAGLFCLNATDGTLIWGFTATEEVSVEAVYSSPAVVDGRVYFFAIDGVVYCVDAIGNGDGTTDLIWMKEGIGGIHYAESPAVVDGKVYVGGKNGVLYQLNASNGNILYSYSTGDADIDCTPAVANGKVYFGTSVSWAADDSHVMCLTTENLSFIWSYLTPSSYSVLSSPAVADGKVYVGQWRAGNVTCLNANTGAKIWSYLTGRPVFSSPAVVDGNVYVGSNDGKLYCFGPNTAPATPQTPSGPTEGLVGDTLTYSTITSDPNGDQVFYQWQFGSYTTDWLGPFDSNVTVQQAFTWNESGSFDVKVKAKDKPIGAMSAYSGALPVHIYTTTLEIGTIDGGLLTVASQVKNTGSVAATNVSWKITVKGGILGLIMVEKTGSFATLSAGATESIKASPIIGLGKLNITISVTSTNGLPATKQADGSVFFIFVKV